MSTYPWICIDPILPPALRHLAPVAAPGGPPDSARAIIFFGKRWPNGSTLHVSFLDGNASQHAIVEQYAVEWSQHANLSFQFGSFPDADIRITFDSTDGSWSNVGTDATTIPLNRATMNFGWLGQGVVLHEFGHAIGLGHEHQHPAGGIQWNKPNVYRDMANQGWTPAMVDSNIFNRYDQSQTQFTALDPTSIMMYPIPATWTLNGFSTGDNEVLSSTDKTFIGGPSGYPGVGGGGPGELAQLVLGQTVDEKIGEPGEEDLFQFNATAAGRYVFETSGSTDVVMTLYGPNSRTALLAQDDDSGPGLNARIVRSLSAGTYYVQVRHYNRQRGRGRYGLKVSNVL